jgi:hypothetical protein
VKKSNKFESKEKCLYRSCKKGRGPGLMCRAHWALVPPIIQQRVIDAYHDVDAWLNLPKGQVPGVFRKALESAVSSIDKA